MILLDDTARVQFQQFQWRVKPPKSELVRVNAVSPGDEDFFDYEAKEAMYLKYIRVSKQIDVFRQLD